MAMLETDRQALTRLNDARLSALVALDGAALEREIEKLIGEAQPVIGGIVARYARSRTLLTREDAEDITANIHLRLVMKLRSVPLAPEEAIENLRGYVAALSYNAVRDHLRKRFPERARLKTRLRYALQQDSRMAIWETASGTACGWAEWRGREDVVDEVPAHAITSQENTAMLAEIFRATRAPAILDALVDAVAEVQNIAGRDTVALEDRLDTLASTARADDLDFMRAVWTEIRELRPMQRRALLLNLRYGGETNVVSLLVLANVATFDEIAEALEMTRTELAAIWRKLPMEDARIAEQFGVTRQQVINLRKAARDRLSRRLRP